MSSYRERVQEIDLSGFATQSNSQVGAMVLKSRKGDKTPKLCQGESEVILRFGKPNSEYFGGFEAIEYSRVAPLWVVSAIGSNYRYAGVDIQTNKVVPFGTRSGRVFETFNDNSYSSIQSNTTYTAASGNTGLSASFSGTITSTLPAIVNTVQLKVGSNIIPVVIDENTNSITSAAFSSTGTFNKTTGEFNITFSGVVGTVASYLTSISIVSVVDLSVNGSEKKVNLEIDGKLYQNVNFGSASGTSKASIISVINSIVGSTVASSEGNYIRILGQIGSSNLGYIKISPPSSGDSALPYIFKDGVSYDSAYNSTSPTGYIPKYGEAVIWDYNYTGDIKDITSFTLFTSSPFDDDFESYSIKVKRLSGKKYKATLYQNLSSGQIEITNYEFSLIREKNNFGKSLYYEDVFSNDEYLKIHVNSSYGNIADPTEEIVLLTGGDRGDEPLTSDYLDAWTNFQKQNKYKVKNIMDVYGNSPTTIKNILENYQPYAFGITVIPIGNNVQSAIQYRRSLGIDFDNMALYTNWMRIEDPYNNSSSWTSGVGKIGVKYSQMVDVFDGLPAAGIDENGHGGQLSGFKVLEVEYDYSDKIGGDLQSLDEAQINPIIFDPFYGVMIYGNKTLQVSNSDTSYIHTRRLSNYMIENISVQILKKQVFKLNDELHRLLAKTQTETFLAPIEALDLVREIYVQCDSKNNNDAVLTVRQFILDVFVKFTPDSEFVTLRLTRLPQDAILANFLVS